MSLSKSSPASNKTFQWWDESDVDTSVRQGLKLQELFLTQSKYQKIGIYEHEELGRVLTLDDIVQTTQADEFVYHEMLAHVPLLGLPHKTARHSEEQSDEESSHEKFSVLIIGGGDGGTLREVLRHDFVERVVMVEIDETVVNVSKEYLQINGDYNDPRVELIIGDGAAYVEAAKENSFDVVLVDSGDPVGPGEILFNEAFCQNVSNSLKPNGIMCRHLCIPAYQKEIFKKGMANMNAVYPKTEIFHAAVPTYIGGDMAFVIGHKQQDQTCVQAQAQISGRYYNECLHSASFALPTWWADIL